ncbi:MAG TPA: disulfide bond formation protein DsbA [Rhodobacteraceae bacterium]|jgi:protein-disulfide isomerase|nr:disulfide bond formation protein DsbA [Paracoccaceae bacterium]
MKHLPLAIGLAAMTMAAPVPALATDIIEMTDGERAAFRAEVRAYILENPEIIMEAVAVLEQRQAAEQSNNDQAMVLSNHDAIFNDGVSHISGNPDGDITIVEFSDYRCAYCKRARPEVEALVKSDGNIRLIYKEFPILGPDSLTTAKFALATLLEAPQSYENMNKSLMALRGQPSPEALRKLALGMGLDADALLAKMDSSDVNQIIQANRALGQQLQISGTPTFILDGQLVRGYVPLAGMQKLVEEARKQ